MKRNLIVWVVLLLVGFVAGVALEFSSEQRLKRDLETVNEQLTTYKTSSQVWQLRDSAALLGLEIARSNYGTAAEYSTKFFDQAREVASQTSDANLRNLLQEILNSRDRITAGIAKQDPAVLAEVQSMVAKVHSGNPR
jgi:GAF domain-containing protein